MKKIQAIAFAVIFMFLVMAQPVNSFEIDGGTKPIAVDPLPPAEPSAPVLKYTYSADELDALAKTVYGEARGVPDDEKALVVWTILQRTDSPGFPNTIIGVITAKIQFYGYKAKHSIVPVIRELCEAEVHKWSIGGAPPTHQKYAPSVPYLFFSGKKGHNWFRRAWR